MRTIAPINPDGHSEDLGTPSSLAGFHREGLSLGSPVFHRRTVPRSHRRTVTHAAKQDVNAVEIRNGGSAHPCECERACALALLREAGACEDLGHRTIDAKGHDVHAVGYLTQCTHLFGGERDGLGQRV